MSVIQLKGNAMIAQAGETLVDRSAVISQLMITRQRNAVTLPADLETGRESEVAGTPSETLTITFRSDTAAASFWAELYDVIDTDSAEIDFEALLNEGAVGTDNPKFAGTATLLSLETGGTVGALRQQTITLPITAAGITKTTV